MKAAEVNRIVGSVAPFWCWNVAAPEDGRCPSNLRYKKLLPGGKVGQQRYHHEIRPYVNPGINRGPT